MKVAKLVRSSSVLAAVMTATTTGGGNESGHCADVLYTARDEDQ